MGLSLIASLLGALGGAVLIGGVGSSLSSA